MAARKRHDPVSKPADGRRQFDKITNKDPRRHYVLVNPHDFDTGLDYYTSSLGYEVVRHTGPDSPRSSVRSIAEGDVVMSGPLVLVSCPIEEQDARVTEGQRIPDSIDRRILKDGNIQDGLRGRGFELGIDREQTAPAAYEGPNGA